jgi:iron(III) transport system ATP-binding protein
MNACLELKKIAIRFGDKLAVDSVNLQLQEGRIGCLLGPSGCGKTTLLRAIAGFQPLTNGEISLRGETVGHSQWNLPPEKRHVGMVFQDFALFPHLTVEQNVGFGISRLPSREKNQRITQLLDIVGLGDTMKRYPHQLSGGQQQLVALARALAPQPDILLLDEPFSSLDVELREQLAREVRSILKQLEITAILVTHDQIEAFAMADEIGVMKDGRLFQWASAYDLYHKPNNRFVADFIGQGSMLPGKLLANGNIRFELGEVHGELPSDIARAEQVEVLVRPDDIIHDDASLLRPVVKDRQFRGAEFLYTLELPSGDEVLCLAPSHHNHPVGEPIGIRLDIEHVRVFPK